LPDGDGYEFEILRGIYFARPVLTHMKPVGSRARPCVQMTLSRRRGSTPLAPVFELEARQPGRA
jgi:hypothetical protein